MKHWHRSIAERKPSDTKLEIWRMFGYAEGKREARAESRKQMADLVRGNSTLFGARVELVFHDEPFAGLSRERIADLLDGPKT